MTSALHGYIYIDSALEDWEIEPLREELDKRGLSKEVERIIDECIVEDPDGQLPRGPQTYGNLSILFWWLREVWLRHKTKDGISVEATIDSTQRTGSRYHSAAREI